jgi:DNA-binding NarL/FixJ family response regulator
MVIDVCQFAVVSSQYILWSLCFLYTSRQLFRPFPPMRALLVDDHMLFSQGLRFLLEDLDPSLQCDSATSIAEAVTTPGPYDLILLDYRLPDSQGAKGLQRVLTAHPDSPVMMLSGDSQPELVNELVDLGAAGFVSKSADTDTLLGALRTMLAGGVYLPPQAVALRVPQAQQAAATSAMATLSSRQRDCLLKLAQGKSNKTIARELDLADSTVKTHIAAVFAALDVSSRAEAVFKAASMGLLPTA